MTDDDFQNAWAVAAGPMIEHIRAALKRKIGKESEALAVTLKVKPAVNFPSLVGWGEDQGCWRMKIEVVDGRVVLVVDGKVLPCVVESVSERSFIGTVMEYGKVEPAERTVIGRRIKACIVYTEGEQQDRDEYV